MKRIKDKKGIYGEIKRITESPSGILRQGKGNSSRCKGSSSRFKGSSSRCKGSSSK